MKFTTIFSTPVTPDSFPRLNRRSILCLWLVLLCACACLDSLAAQPTPGERLTVMVPMRDRTKLATDIYLPTGTGPWPVVLARTPYNKDFGQEAHKQFTARGYAFVAQDSRGRFKSEGKTMAYDTDGWSGGLGDGFDTVEWIATQPWSNGKVGTWGGSALSIAQYLMAGASPPHLVAQHLNVGAPSMYRDIVYRDGAFRKNLIEEWLKSQKFDPDQLKAWKSHPTEDAYWLERDTPSRWGRVNAAGVHIGGWYDAFTQGVLDAYLGYQKKGGPRARGNQKLVLGPWPHAVFQRQAGIIEFPENAAAPPVPLHDPLLFFDHFLKGADNGFAALPSVAYYTMGDTSVPGAPGNLWRTANTWPPNSRKEAWRLGPAGELLEPHAPRATPGPGFLAYTYDPSNPTPTEGGNHGGTLPTGPRDQRSVHTRRDLLLFNSGVLTAPKEVTGRVRAKLWVSSDCPDTDFTVKLCDVLPDGRVLNICDGLVRMKYRRSLRQPELLRPGTVYPVTVDLWSTSYMFNMGHRLRVEVASCNYPGYEANPNTGENPDQAHAPRIAHNQVYVSAKFPSQIILPVVER